MGPVGKLKLPFHGSNEITYHYSDTGQDIFVLSVLNGIQGGKFVEIGSGRPCNFNNTYLLETNFNFAGFGVDIRPDLVESYNSTRKNKAILGDATTLNYSKIFYQLGWDLSNSIDYASIDCDPSRTSFLALQNLLLTGAVFKIITFEHDSYLDGVTVRDNSRIILKSLGYEMAAKGVRTLDGYEFEDWWINPVYVDIDRVKRLWCEKQIWADIVFTDFFTK